MITSEQRAEIRRLRVRDLRVTPHPLTAYDALLTPPPAEEPSDE